MVVCPFGLSVTTAINSKHIFEDIRLAFQLATTYEALKDLLVRVVPVNQIEMVAAGIDARALFHFGMALVLINCVHFGKHIQ